MYIHKVEYTVDLSTVTVFNDELRQTVTGRENTLQLLIPPKGCGYGCDFCSVKHVRYPSFPVMGVTGHSAAQHVVE